MRFFTHDLTQAPFALALLGTFLLVAAADARPRSRFPAIRDLEPSRSGEGADSSRSAPAPRRQKPAEELISKQAQPKVVPRVLERANSGNTHVTISLGKQRAYLMVGDEIAIDTPISSGKSAGMTPKGSFTILEMDADHRSSIYGSFVNSRGEIVRSGVSTRIDSAPSGTSYRGAPMQWFMRMTWTGVGMHVGELPGYPASHGCIRMPQDIAPLFYQRVKLGSNVTVTD